MSCNAVFRTSVTREPGLRGLPTHRRFTPSEGGVPSLSVALQNDGHPPISMPPPSGHYIESIRIVE